MSDPDEAIERGYFNKCAELGKAQKQLREAEERIASYVSQYQRAIAAHLQTEERAEKAEAALAAYQAGDEVLTDLMDGNEP